jgi:hypothetical protein
MDGHFCIDAVVHMREKETMHFSAFTELSRPQRLLKIGTLIGCCIRVVLHTEVYCMNGLETSDQGFSHPVQFTLSVETRLTYPDIKAIRFLTDAPPFFSHVALPFPTTLPLPRLFLIGDSGPPAVGRSQAASQFRVLSLSDRFAVQTIPSTPMISPPLNVVV